MELNDLIPDNNKNWIVKNNFLYFYKYQNIPTCYIEDNCAFILLDKKVKKQITKLLKFILNNKINFFIVTPELSNPKGIDDFNYDNVYNYIRALTDLDWIGEFEKINFDIIDNLIKFVRLYNCVDQIKPVHDKLSKRVYKEYYDYYLNKKVFDYPEIVRENFNNLLRQIQLSIILN